MGDPAFDGPGSELNRVAEFFAYAARAMRGLIVSHVRERRAVKRGGEFHFTSFDATDPVDNTATAERLGPLSDAASTSGRRSATGTRRGCS